MTQQLILITGVSRGLGLAMADEFIRLGHRVVGCARSREKLAPLRERYAGGHRFDEVDVSKNQSVRAWAKRVLAEHGAPDLLVNNAAIINQNAPLWDVPAAEFRQIVDTNIKGVFHVIRHFVPAMTERRTGVIVNFSSGWGRSTSPEVAPYCATKWAIEGLTRALADELPGGMAAVALNPGIIHTPMLESCFGDEAASYPSPYEWAQRAVPFLLKLTPADNGSSLDVPC
jgi:NAD(P)-dependent dehydrogenase (short-subunit alcohol dehydrogenase family)